MSETSIMATKINALMSSTTMTRDDDDDDDDDNAVE